jgi:two-component sensor histidine kinase
MELRLPPRAASVSAARHRVAAFVHGLGADSNDIELAVTEAVANSVEHGFRGRAEGTIVIRVETLVPDTIAVTVSDDGVGIAPNPDRAGLGLGLAVIGRLTSDLEIRPGRPRGTAVHMRFPLRSSSAEAERPPPA